MPDYIEYCGHRIPVHTGKSARGLYNLPDSDIDHFRCGTKFTEEGDLFEGEPPGSAYGDRMPMFDLQECKERAEFAEAHDATIFSMWARLVRACKNQNGWPFCWGYGGCTAYEWNWCLRHGFWTDLSPEVTCLEATGGRIRGGWAKEWFEAAEKNGIVPQSMVTPRDRRQHRTVSAEAQEARKQYVPDEVVHFRRGDMDSLRSSLVSNIASGIGLMWWGHLVAFGGWTWREKYGGLWLYQNSHSDRFGMKGWAFTTDGPATHGGGSALLVA